MVEVTRRGFLKGSTASIINSRALPLSAFAVSALTPLDAKAWVAAALAAAGAVAGMIAAHNRGDGGLSAMLTANFDLLNVAISKLDDIQTRLTDIYVQLMGLTGEVDNLLTRAATRRLHVEMLGVVKGYEEKLLKRDPTMSFARWQKDPTTVADMSNLLARMHKARQELNVQDLADPATALVAATTGFVETNIMNVLGYGTYEITATIDVVYLPWLDGIMDSGRADSAAGYAVAAGERLKSWSEKASLNPIGKSLGMKPGNSALLACTGVNDYTPSQPINKRQCDPPSIANSWTPTNEFVSPSDAKARIETLAYYRHCYIAHVGDTDPRVGVRDRLAISASLQETEVVLGGNQTGLLELSAPSSGEIHAAAGTPTLPDDGQCEIVTADIPGEPARVGYMKAMRRRAEADTAYAELLQIVDQINLERGRIAFGVQAVVACQSARDNLVVLREMYR